MIWALGTFGHAPVGMAFLVSLAEARLPQCNEQDQANLLYGLAACGQPDLATPEFLAAAERRACSVVMSFTPQACPRIVLLCCACSLCVSVSSTMPGPVTSWVYQILSCVVMLTRYLPCMQGLSNVMWAFASLEADAPDLAAAAGQEVPRRIGTFNPRGHGRAAVGVCQDAAPRLARRGVRHRRAHGGHHQQHRWVIIFIQCPTVQVQDSKAC